MLLGLLAAGHLDQDATHRLGCGSEEGTAAVPARCFPVADQPQLGLVDQGRRLKRVSGRLMGQLMSGEPTQFFVHQRQELARGVGVALMDLVHDPRHLKDDGSYTLLIRPWLMPARNFGGVGDNIARRSPARLDRPPAISGPVPGPSRFNLETHNLLGRRLGQSHQNLRSNQLRLFVSAFIRHRLFPSADSRSRLGLELPLSSMRPNSHSAR